MDLVYVGKWSQYCGTPKEERRLREDGLKRCACVLRRNDSYIMSTPVCGVLCQSASNVISDVTEILVNA